MTYNLTGYWKGRIICRYALENNEEDFLYKEIALPMIKQGFAQKYHIGIQIKLCEVFLDALPIQMMPTDDLLALSSLLCLRKYKQSTDDDDNGLVFLKIK